MRNRFLLFFFDRRKAFVTLKNYTRESPTNNWRRKINMIVGDTKISNNLLSRVICLFLNTWIS